jgi:hypothetical protein
VLAGIDRGGKVERAEAGGRRENHGIHAAGKDFFVGVKAGEAAFFGNGGAIGDAVVGLGEFGTCAVDAILEGIAEGPDLDVV